MAITQTNATRWRITTSSGNNTTFLDLDSSIPNGMGVLHGQIISLINSDVEKGNRIQQLLEDNPSFAFVVFCLENNLYVPPDDPAVEPAP
jgi:hypothetical protein